MVLLDVVYNHFGPDGNYLHLYAPEFFHPERRTPWGAAIAYEIRAVRDFFIENALYWLEEYRLDGLRLDAINQIEDQSTTPLLEELAHRVREAFSDRRVHLTTEDDRNITRLHNRDPDGRVAKFTAEWNDDFHHAAHVLATRETEGYYRDYLDPVPALARSLAEGFVYQGEASPFWSGQPRGEPSGHLPPAAFIDFLQNHDQIGNRAFGERLTTLAPEATVTLLTALMLLSPHIPMLFMGEEWGERRPFYYFTNFDGDLARLVRDGRRDEFRSWSAFHDPARRDLIPDPNAPETFAACVLAWNEASSDAGSQRIDLVRRLLDIRANEIAPRLAGMRGGEADYLMLGRGGFRVTWPTVDGALVLLANLSAEAIVLDPAETQDDRLLFASSESADDAGLAPMSLRYSIRSRA